MLAGMHIIITMKLSSYKTKQAVVIIEWSEGGDYFKDLNGGWLGMLLKNGKDKYCLHIVMPSHIRCFWGCD